MIILCALFSTYMVGMLVFAIILAWSVYVSEGKLSPLEFFLSCIVYPWVLWDFFTKDLDN